MSNPRHRSVAARRMRANDRRLSARQAVARRTGFARGLGAPAKPPSNEVAEPMLLEAGPRVLEAAARPMVWRRSGGVARRINRFGQETLWRGRHRNVSFAASRSLMEAIMGAVAASGVLRRERLIVQAYRDAGATSPERARTPDELLIHSDFALNRLMD